MPQNRVTMPKRRQVTQPILYSAADYYGRDDRTGPNGAEPMAPAREDDHDFYARICDDLSDQAEVVIVGNRNSVRNFHDFVQTNRRGISAIMNYEIATDLDDGQFAVFTRDSSSDN